MTVQAQNNLATNTLASDGGNQISQYYGHWALDQPDIGQGQCVQVHIISYLQYPNIQIFIISIISIMSIII